MDERNITEERKTPEYVNFTVSQLITKPIQVRGGFEGRSAEGFTAETPVFTPSTISVTGPEAYIRDIDHQTKTAEGGIFIGEPDCLGKGIGTCCVKILETFSRERLGLEYIRVRIFKDNKASVRIHEKLGYTWESDLPGVVCTDGTVGDMIFMGHAITDGVDSLSYDFETIT